MARAASAPRPVSDSAPTTESAAPSVLDLIGNTPIVEIRRVASDLPSGVRIFAKLEGFNPGGSVKDRAALSMVQDGLRSGALRPGKTIIDPRSGNTGMAVGLVGG